MKLLYHVVPPSIWDRAGDGPYRAASLQTEGFIHCSYENQVARVANLFYADQAALLALCIDPGRLTHPVRDEDVGTGERFPHVYGPIEREAVVAVSPLQRDAEGRWFFESRIV
jgi:glutathione S-transferase